MKCEICKKKTEGGCVCYSEIESYLCKKHYNEWLKEHEYFEKKYGETAGNSKLCKKIEKQYIDWLFAHGVKIKKGGVSMTFKEDVGESKEEIIKDLAYYTSHPDGVRLIFAISTFITIFVGLTFISTIRWIILVVFGLTAIGFGWRLKKIKNG